MSTEAQLLSHPLVRATELNIPCFFTRHSNFAAPKDELYPSYKFRQAGSDLHRTVSIFSCYFQAAIVSLALSFGCGNWDVDEGGATWVDALSGLKKERSKYHSRRYVPSTHLRHHLTQRRPRAPDKIEPNLFGLSYSELSSVYLKSTPDLGGYGDTSDSHSFRLRLSAKMIFLLFRSGRRSCTDTDADIDIRSRLPQPHRHP
ncbi:hypothetical protein R3P38DRAFT_3244145 [Favolaschia claudopus]|uniref:Uncharacterized protein n=1 Tax=Favolaschia claudopus TaxID=2862362 RepID=A0AAV9Z212_9AGAR